ncbi:flagellar motor protein MotD [Pleionea sp. CnH1-48]|uniref:flagellar motor protein MotD n=1 Tax=Pleionea sp. CnH1-48 TaxID=2954494 RepID=UPI002097F12A|nr:flagellar motor protein MotD [Pleionea sp. CnH1-48]MCO7226092.1 flagellar motor protein MotD [Pleionea sp. CnH1-48]
MLRKRSTEQEENLDRWLVSYADFMTLLFAFFVVMYSISQVNEGKYRILSQSMLSAFDVPESSLQPIQEGEINRTEQPVSGDSLDPPGAAEDVEKVSNDENYISAKKFEAIERNLQGSLEDLIAKDLVTIRKTRDWLEIDLRSALLFNSGSETLGPSANVLLKEIATQLTKHQQRISVRGHTDNIPIDTQRFQSNWELSAARAAAVVRKLQKSGVGPSRMSVEAYGEHNPIATNGSAKGRAKNRRVTVAISRYKLKETEKASDTAPQVQQKSSTTKSDNKPAPTKSEEATDQEYEITRLPSGGLLIRGKSKPDDKDKKP